MRNGLQGSTRPSLDLRVPKRNPSSTLSSLRSAVLGSSCLPRGSLRPVFLGLKLLGLRSAANDINIACIGTL